MANREYPELQSGTRIQYSDKGVTRSERIIARHGNTITVENAVGRRKRINISQVRGYWSPRVKASTKNLILLSS